MSDDFCVAALQMPVKRVLARFLPASEIRRQRSLDRWAGRALIVVKKRPSPADIEKELKAVAIDNKATVVKRHSKRVWEVKGVLSHAKKFRTFDTVNPFMGIAHHVAKAR